MTVLLLPVATPVSVMNETCMAGLNIYVRVTSVYSLPSCEDVPGFSLLHVVLFHFHSVFVRSCLR